MGKSRSYWIHSIIGILLMVVIPLLPPIEPATELGMSLGGIFIGLIYLWSLVDTLWPSLLGIVMLGMVPEIGMTGIFAGFSAYIPLLIFFCFIFCGAVSDSGLTVYIGRWFLTRKIIEGRPLVFNFMMMTSIYVVSGLIDPIAAIMVMWPIMYSVLNTVGYTSKDQYPRVLTVCSFMAITLGMCIIPFWGAPLAMMSAFEAASGLKVNYVAYLIFNVGMGLLIIALMSIAMKYIFHVDMEKMKQISVEKINENKLPPMDLRQKIYIGAVIAFFAFAILPSLLPQTWAIVIWMNKLTMVGFTIILITLLILFNVNGKPLLDTSRIKEYVPWNMYFIVIVTVFLSGILLTDETGLKQLLLNILMPVLSKFGAITFVVILIVLGLFLTNYANNLIVGTVFVQLIAAIAPELGLNPLPIAMVTVICMYAALLSPAASPYAPALHTNTEYTSSKEIMRYGMVLMIICAVTYLLIGIPVAYLVF